MCALLQEKYPNAEIVYVFANTGKEHLKTLEFVDRCDRHFGLRLVWVEAVVHQERKGCTHRIVDFASAARKEEPFRKVIAKYGIPNMSYPHCTRELKLNPMYSYIDSLGWAWGSYQVAIGIRSDEPKRILESASSNNIFYPLADAGIEKPDVLDFWKRMPFDLEIQEHEGNCTTCYKKSDLKHVINIKQNPQWYDFNKEMEKEFGALKADEDHENRVFFRKNRSTEEMFDLAAVFDEIPDIRHLNRPAEDAGCGESCEAVFERKS